MEVKCIQIAAEMLDIKSYDVEFMSSTHTELFDWLMRVNTLCRMAGGELVSRQAIAIIVDGWQVKQ